MHIRLKDNVVLTEYGAINAGVVLHFPDKLAVMLLNSGAAEPVKTSTQKETALKP